MKRVKKKKEFIYKGVKFKSPDEMHFAEKLDEAGLEWEYEKRSDALTWIPKPKKYYADFSVILKDGRKVYAEIKGKRLWTGDSGKYMTIKEQHPDFPLFFVWTDASKKQPHVKYTGEDFCRKLGYPCTTNGDIPKEWTEIKK